MGTSDLAEGRGRIPGQQNFEVQLGGYSTLDEVVADLTAPLGGEAPYNKWDSGEGSKWISVFGTSTVDPNYLGGVLDIKQVVMMGIHIISMMKCFPCCKQKRESFLAPLGRTLHLCCHPRRCKILC